MKKKIKFISFLYIIFFFLIFIKIEYLNPFNTLWLYNDNADNAAMQAAWYFFRNDIWRFPLGLNPNYGEGLDNTIILTDSIPIFAIFFKLVGFFIKSEFQYISFWYFLCFFLQFYFAYKILNHYTRNQYFSFFFANFFLLAPVFLYRLTLDPGGTSAHWILLWFIYYLVKYKFNLSVQKILLILLVAASINIYFIAIISIPIFLLFLFKFFLNLENKITLLKKFFTIYSILLLFMFVLGYFSTPFTSSIGGGFGVYNLNLLTIFDPIVERRDQIWSNFFSSQNISQNSKIQAFNYLGLGQFSIIFFAIFAFCKNRNILNNYFKFEKNYLFFLLITVISLFFLALSNKIYFGNNLLFEIKLNNYLLAILSIFRVSARFFFLVTYLILFISIIIIFIEFKKKIYIIFSICFFLQLLDTFPGLKKNFKYNFESPISNFENFYDIFNNYQIINTSYPENYSNKFTYFSGYFEKFKTKTTNFTVQARFDKKKAARNRVDIYDRLFNKKIKNNEIIIIENISHLKYLKTKFDINNFIFLLRNNIWFLANKGKLEMSEFEIKNFNNIELDPIILNEVIKLNFQKHKYLGLGWTYPKEYNHKDNESGVWSEGNKSVLLFKLKDDKKISANFIYDSNIITEKYKISMDVFINNIYYKNFLINSSTEKNLLIIIDPKNYRSKDIVIELNFSNIHSPWEQAFKPDFRFLGIKLKSVEFQKID
jgi:hypothetical protein